jgi:pimeloyl-ACP methyl ester carboxylesterase
MMRILAALLLSATAAMAAENHYFDSDGTRLRYLADGDGDTVLLLHGFSGSAEGLYVRPGTFDALVDAGYRVIALDQRGHGDSQKPHDPDAYGLEMVEDVRRLLDHLEIDAVHLAGYSMGAKVSATFLAAYPTRVRSIVLGGYGWPWRTSRQTIEQANERLKTRTVLPGNDIQALAAVSVGMYDLTPSESVLKSNQVPAIAIIGDNDAAVPVTDRDTLAETMANLELVIIPGTHAGPDGAPYKPVYVEKMLGFLDNQ